MMRILTSEDRSRCTSEQCLFTFIEKRSDLVDIRSQVRHIRGRGGQLVYDQGEVAHNCYWLCHGRIKLACRNRHGKQQFIRFVQPGQLFGLEDLVGRETYDEYAQVVEESQLAVVEERDTLLALLDKPIFAAAALTALVGEVFEVEDRLKFLLSRGALARIAYVLLTSPDSHDAKQQKGDQGRLHLTNEVLASMIGTSPQTVSGCLSELQRRGLITRGRSRVTILEPARLEAFL